MGGGFAARPGAGGEFNPSSEVAAEHAKNSIKENRVYVGNLSYDVKYKDLEQFMTDGALDFVAVRLPRGAVRGWRPCACGVCRLGTGRSRGRAGAG